MLYFSKTKLIIIYLIISFLSLSFFTNFINNKDQFFLSKKKNQRTTQEIELKKKKTQLEEVIKTNTYEKMLEVFPDAKLITIEESKEKK